MLIPGQAADTSMLIDTHSPIRVPGRTGRPRSRPDRVLADKGYPSRAHRAWLRERDIATTIPERNDQIAHRRKKPGRPIGFGDEQRVRHRGRNVVERCFNKLKQGRGIAMRACRTARNDHAAVCLAATLQPVRKNALTEGCGWLAEEGCVGMHTKSRPLRHSDVAALDADAPVGVVAAIEVWLRDPGAFVEARLHG